MRYRRLWLLWLSVVGPAILAGSALYGYVFIAGAPQLDAIGGQAIPGLDFKLESFQSQAMGTLRQYGVILPPGYAQHPQQNYPVIFLLHGGHDGVTAYDQKYAIASVLHQLYGQKKLPPSIVIMPDGNDRRGSSPLWDPQYFDGPNGKVGTLIGTELVQVVKSRYRTAHDPEQWAMGGISSGGWGAVNIGLRHLDHFKTLFSLSGYFTDPSGAHNSPEQFISQLPAQDLQGLRIYLAAGKNREDTFFRHSSHRFHQTLNQLKIDHVLAVFPGGHGLSGPDVGWNFFHRHLSDALSFVGHPVQPHGSPPSSAASRG
ncbi:alpha/beta hydrolase [Lyngbya confervoides]|uniref:Alpha/beta hydrolase-fold protein n=1 Tax=Lyngbya confervoides BDU141951 TaxID=1574623 RepID=A0ABD4T0P5_9CYAN|nr:alpha/beta hydrolase-fold protein [Lyngbya confervoides]MCM1981925.1 alpha/beta hydrolase-fold protein [Lyngbya confervoides BDU141951]